MRACYPPGLNKGFRSKCNANSWVRQKDPQIRQNTHKEGRSLHRPKHCEHNTEEESSSLENPNNTYFCTLLNNSHTKNYRKKLRQLLS